MEKIKVFKYNQFLMTMLGIHSYNIAEPTNEYFKTPIVYIILFISFFVSGASSGIFAYENFDDFFIVLQCVYIVVLGIQQGGMHLSIGLNMNVVKATHLRIQSIVDQGKLKHLSYYKYLLKDCSDIVFVSE